jgi:hypothetical protein
MPDEVWENVSRIPYPALTEKIAAELVDLKRCCRAVGYAYLCTRPPGHPNRHIATGLRDRDIIYPVAAWPGTHPPTPEDML